MFSILWSTHPRVEGRNGTKAAGGEESGSVGPTIRREQKGKDDEVTSRARFVTRSHVWLCFSYARIIEVFEPISTCWAFGG